jgi:cyclic pyranopterin phosphate synthase
LRNDLLLDTHGRRITYLRVSVTDRCNLNCIYCNPSRYAKKLAHGDILTYEELLSIIEAGAGLGITKVRITGGEPLVRKDACDFIGSVSAISGITDLSLTTNGVVLVDCAGRLRKAGVNRINISLDTLDRRRFKTITGHDRFDRVWKGIQAALKAGFSPVKLNMVVMRGINDDEVADFARLVLKWPVHVRFIEQMPVETRLADAEAPLLGPDIQALIAGAGHLVPIGDTGDGSTAQRFTLDGAKGEIGIIRPVSHHFCKTCNRLRLTADGRLRPCLMSDRAVDIKGPLRGGASLSEIEATFREAVRLKPGGHNAVGTNGSRLPREMWCIGG